MHGAELEQQGSNGAEQRQELQHLERCLVEATISCSCLPRTPCPAKKKVYPRNAPSWTQGSAHPASFRSSISGVAAGFLPPPDLGDKNPNLGATCCAGKCVSAVNNALHPSSTTDVLTKPELLCEDARHFLVKVLHCLIST